MLSHFGWLVLRVEDGQLREHAHVGSLQAQGGLHEGDQFLEVPTVLIVVDEFLQFVCVDHDVEATDLGQTELFCIHTRETDLLGEEGGRGEEGRTKGGEKRWRDG